jgi:Rab proteins geranylgeranyltransferase component A
VAESGDEGKKVWSQDEVKKLYRKFNIDLAPKLLYSRGALVELLISSNIARYTEFRNVSRVVTWHDGKLTPVPCSRADVFSTQNISVVEKRMLMNLLQECTEYEGNPEKVKGTFNLQLHVQTNFINHVFVTQSTRTSLSWTS